MHAVAFNVLKQTVAQFSSFAKVIFTPAYSLAFLKSGLLVSLKCCRIVIKWMLITSFGGGLCRKREDWYVLHACGRCGCV